MVLLLELLTGSKSEHVASPDPDPTFRTINGKASTCYGVDCCTNVFVHLLSSVKVLTAVTCLQRSSDILPTSHSKEHRPRNLPNSSADCNSVSGIGKYFNVDANYHFQISHVQYINSFLESFQVIVS